MRVRGSTWSSYMPRRALLEPIPLAPGGWTGGEEAVAHCLLKPTPLFISKGKSCICRSFV